jgi:hypothetical protein
LRLQFFIAFNLEFGDHNLIRSLNFERDFGVFRFGIAVAYATFLRSPYSVAAA